MQRRAVVRGEEELKDSRMGGSAQGSSATGTHLCIVGEGGEIFFPHALLLAMKNEWGRGQQERGKVESTQRFGRG